MEPSEYARNDGRAVYSKLKRMIINCDIPDDDRINLASLSKMLKVSVTPIREALIRLEAESIVGSASRFGFYVKYPSPIELRALNELAYLVLRHTLETFLESSRAIPNEPVVRGHQTLTDESDLKKAEIFYSINVEKLFCVIAALGDNPEIMRVINNYNHRTRFFRLLEAQQCSNSRKPGELDHEIYKLDEQVRKRQANAATSTLRSYLIDRSVEDLMNVARSGRRAAGAIRGLEHAASIAPLRQ